jgi:acetyl-CoA carboxylase biotin carboxyl carrier protein
MAKRPKNASAGKPTTGVDLPEVERMLSFMEQHGLEEFEYERNGLHVRLKKPSILVAGAPRVVAAHEVAPASSTAHAGPHAHAAPAGHKEPHADSPNADDVHVVKSPIVGTFYISPSPDTAPFVTVGARVESGQVLCIIEAMKLMNEIESDVAGEVTRIFVENGQPVEYGEPLFGIRPHGKK